MYHFHPGGEHPTALTSPIIQNGSAAFQNQTSCSPLSTSRCFFYEDILEVLVEQSELYALQCDITKPIKLTANELEHDSRIFYCYTTLRVCGIKFVLRTQIKKSTTLKKIK